MAPGLLEKLKTKKSKEVISAKAAVPAPAVESPKADSKRRKRKSQAGADDTPSTSTSVQPATTTEAAPKKSKKKADALPIEPAQVPPVAEKAPAKKGKGEQEELADERVSSGAASLKGKRKEKGAGAVDKGSVAGEKKGKGKEAQLEVEVDTEVEKRAKSKKGRKSKKEEEPVEDDLPEAKSSKQEKSAKISEAAPAKEVQPKPSKKAPKEPNATPMGISHPTISSKPKDKKKRKAPSPEPEPSASDKDEEPAEKDVDDDGEADHIYGFSTDDDDSSDEEMGDAWDGIDVTKLPTIAKDDAVVKKRLDQAKKHPTVDRGVIYLGRIPHGFYEDQMRQYLSQFGTVTRLRLSRSKKTGRSKHYAFIEFDSSSVAEIVADTMDNYLLMGHILTCKIIPKDEVHPELWIGANKKWRVIPRDRIARVQHNKPRTEEEQERAEKRLLKRQSQRKRKLEEAGINYDFGAVAYKKSKPVEV